MSLRLDKATFSMKLVSSRSQAENYIKLGLITVNGKVIKKPGYAVDSDDTIILVGEKYVSRAALKLASIAEQFKLEFRDKTVLDVGSSTGGFTDYALQHGAQKVVAIDVGTNQLHSSLRINPKVELYEKTDIRNVRLKSKHKDNGNNIVTIDPPDLIVIDVSFISMKYILPTISNLMHRNTQIIAMCKPQFEAGRDQINKGVVKNSAMRRMILKGFEFWLQNNDFKVINKADSQVSGTKGNIERFYKIELASKLK